MRTPSPYEFLPSYKVSEGNVYKSPIFIKTEEANVPALTDINYNGDSCQIPDSKKSTNGLLCHEDLLYNSKTAVENSTTHLEVNELNRSPDLPSTNDIQECIMQDVTNVVNCDLTTDEKVIMNCLTKQDNTDRPAHSKKHKKSHKINNHKMKDGPVVIEKPCHHRSALVEEINYDLLEGKKGVELLTAIEHQANVNLRKMDFHFTSSSESNGNSESPRKARTRSVESVIWDIEDKRERKGVKRPRSVATGPEYETPMATMQIEPENKIPKLETKSEEPTSQVPIVKQVGFQQVTKRKLIILFFGVFYYSQWTCFS